MRTPKKELGIGICIGAAVIALAVGGIFLYVKYPILKTEVLRETKTVYEKATTYVHPSFTGIRGLDEMLRMSVFKDAYVSVHIGPDPGQEREFWREIMSDIRISDDRARLQVRSKQVSEARDYFLGMAGVAPASAANGKDGTKVYRSEAEERAYKMRIGNDYAWNEVVVVEDGDVYTVYDFVLSSESESVVEDARKAWQAVVNSALLR